MNKRRRRNPNSPEVIAERLRMGRGKGRGTDYRPWETTHDFHSRGVRFRIWNPLTKRIHHLFSMLEYYLYVIFATDPTVIDIREQFPLLDFDRVSDASERVRSEYPNSRAGSQGNVLTTDFVITRKVGTEWWDEPFGAKYLRDTKTDEYQHRKLLGKYYWEGFGCTEEMLSELDAPPERVRSAEWILQANTDYFLSDLATSQRIAIANEIRDACAQHRQEHLAGVAAGLDIRLGLELGTAIDVSRWMLASRQWIPADGTTPFPSAPLILAN